MSKTKNPQKIEQYIGEVEKFMDVFSMNNDSKMYADVFEWKNNVQTSESNTQSGTWHSGEELNKLLLDNISKLDFVDRNNLKPKAKTAFNAFESNLKGIVEKLGNFKNTGDFDFDNWNDEIGNDIGKLGTQLDEFNKLTDYDYAPFAQMSVLKALVNRLEGVDQKIKNEEIEEFLDEVSDGVSSIYNEQKAVDKQLEDYENIPDDLKVPLGHTTSSSEILGQCIPAIDKKIDSIHNKAEKLNEEFERDVLDKNPLYNINDDSYAYLEELKKREKALDKVEQAAAEVNKAENNVADLEFEDGNFISRGIKVDCEKLSNLSLLNDEFNIKSPADLDNDAVKQSYINKLVEINPQGIEKSDKEAVDRYKNELNGMSASRLLKFSENSAKQMEARIEQLRKTDVSQSSQKTFFDKENRKLLGNLQNLREKTPARLGSLYESGTKNKYLEELERYNPENLADGSAYYDRLSKAEPQEIVNYVDEQIKIIEERIIENEKKPDLTQNEKYINATKELTEKKREQFKAKNNLEDSNKAVLQSREKLRKTLTDSNKNAEMSVSDYIKGVESKYADKMSITVIKAAKSKNAEEYRGFIKKDADLNKKAGILAINKSLEKNLVGKRNEINEMITNAVDNSRKINQSIKSHLPGAKGMKAFDDKIKQYDKHMNRTSELKDKLGGYCKMLGECKRAGHIDTAEYKLLMDKAQKAQKDFSSDNLQALQDAAKDYLGKKGSENRIFTTKMRKHRLDLAKSLAEFAGNNIEYAKKCEKFVGETAPHAQEGAKWDGENKYNNINKENTKNGSGIIKKVNEKISAINNDIQSSAKKIKELTDGEPVLKNKKVLSNSVGFGIK